MARCRGQLRLYFATAHQPVAAQAGRGGGVTGEWCWEGKANGQIWAVPAEAGAAICREAPKQNARGALGCSGGGEDSIDKPRKCVMESGIFDIHAAHIILYITWVNYSSYGRLSGNGDEQKAKYTQRRLVLICCSNYDKPLLLLPVAITTRSTIIIHQVEPRGSRG